MGYRNLTQKQFLAVKDIAAYICTEQKLKTIGEYKRVGNEIIDDIESGTKKFVTDCKGDIFIVASHAEEISDAAWLKAQPVTTG